MLKRINKLYSAKITRNLLKISANITTSVIAQYHRGEKIFKWGGRAGYKYLSSPQWILLHTTLYSWFNKIGESWDK